MTLEVRTLFAIIIVVLMATYVALDRKIGSIRRGC
jgi:hypothetical protein